MATDELCNCEQAIALTQALRNIHLVTQDKEFEGSSIETIEMLARVALRDHGSPEVKDIDWLRRRFAEHLLEGRCRDTVEIETAKLFRRNQERLPPDSNWLGKLALFMQTTPEMRADLKMRDRLWDEAIETFFA